MHTKEEEEVCLVVESLLNKVCQDARIQSEAVIDGEENKINIETKENKTTIDRDLTNTYDSKNALGIIKEKDDLEYNNDMALVPFIDADKRTGRLESFEQCEKVIRDLIKSLPFDGDEKDSNNHIPLVSDEDVFDETCTSRTIASLSSEGFEKFFAQNLDIYNTPLCHHPSFDSISSSRDTNSLGSDDNLRIDIPSSSRSSIRISYCTESDSNPDSSANAETCYYDSDEAEPSLSPRIKYIDNDSDIGTYAAAVPKIPLDWLTGTRKRKPKSKKEESEYNQEDDFLYCGPESGQQEDIMKSPGEYLTRKFII